MEALMSAYVGPAVLHGSATAYLQRTHSGPERLVMVPSSAFDVLVSLRDWLARDLRLEDVLGRPWAERRPIEFGDLAWLSVFDDDDQMEFHRELHEALMLTLASDSTEPVDRCVREWRTTARALSDTARRTVLVGAVTEDDFEEVDRPA